MPNNPSNSLALATASPLAPTTTVAVSATIDFNGQQISINTGDIRQGVSNLNFSLSNPVEVGSLNNFLDYLNRQVGVPLTSAELTDFINKIPDAPEALASIRDALLKIASTSLWITVLNVNVKAGTFALGVSFPVDLSLGFLTLQNIGILVSKGSTTPGSP